MIYDGSILGRNMSKWSKAANAFLNIFLYFCQGTANATSAINHHWFLFVRITQTQSLGCHLGKGLTLWTLCTFEMTHVPFLAGEHGTCCLDLCFEAYPCPVEAQSLESNMTCNKEFEYCCLLFVFFVSVSKSKGLFWSFWIQFLQKNMNMSNYVQETRMVQAWCTATSEGHNPLTDQHFR